MMYEIHIKLRNVVTGEEENFHTIRKYKSKGKAARDAGNAANLLI
ncbi:TPA: hypothetical protein ACWR4Q_003717 [Escherichia coli]